MNWRQRRLSGASRGTLALLLVCAVAGCGSGSDGDASEGRAKPLGQLLAGSVAHLAQCKDWVGGSRERKLATIEDIRAQVNRRDTGIEAPPLSDEEALGLFDRACSNSFARSFRLYAVYARAAAFAPLTRGAPPSE
jgi:hypothetical protein